MDKKMAKSEMLRELSKAMSDDQYSPLSDLMKNKKMQKVTVMSDSPMGLKKGLSKAEELLKLKGLEKEDSMESEDESEEMEEEGEEEEKMGLPADDEEKALYEKLKLKYG